MPIENGRQEEIKSGFVALIGPPNAGKSTLLNRYLETKLSITSPKPQTTRNQILGVWTRPEAQVVFLDTPGIHRPSSALHRSMVDLAVAALNQVDVVVWLIDVFDRRHREDKLIPKHLKEIDKPILLALNKIDKIKPHTLLPLIDSFNQAHDLKAIVPISALTGDGCQELAREITDLLPHQGTIFPEDALTDLPERFLCGEIVREKVMRQIHQEIPYGVAVTVSDWKEDEQKNLISIRAEIHVDKTSHKGVIIGKQGRMIKSIGSQARQDIEELLAARVYLDLFVKVDPDWTRNPRLVHQFRHQEFDR